MRCVQLQKIKKEKKEKKEEELPSFLGKEISLPTEISLPSKLTKNDIYTGPLFFGACDKLHHPQHHSAMLATSKLPQPTIYPTEYFSNLFLPQSDAKPQRPPKHFFHVRKRKNSKRLVDTGWHSSLGRRKIFKFEAIPREIIIGKTKSIIETEISEDIPCFKHKYPTIRGSKKEEIMGFTDMKNNLRKLLTPEERAAHSHFPKRFITVELIGPRIPASFTITKIPSKRRKFYEWDYRFLRKLSQKTSDAVQEVARPSGPLKDLKKNVSYGKGSTVSQARKESRKSVTLSQRFYRRKSSVGSSMKLVVKSKEKAAESLAEKKHKLTSKSQRGTAKRGKAPSKVIKFSLVNVNETNKKNSSVQDEKLTSIHSIESRKRSYLADAKRKKIRIESV